MTAPFCAEHPAGGVTRCGDCSTAWDRHALFVWQSENPEAYADALAHREHEFQTNGTVGIPRDARRILRDLQRRAELVRDERVLRVSGEQERDASAVGEIERHELPGAAVSHLVVRRAELVRPVVVGVALREVEDGAVVVQSRGHERKRIAGRLLAAAALAGIALWAVAS